MTNSAGHLRDEYAEAFESHLKAPGEATLSHAYEIGRTALQGGLGVLDVAVMHHDALRGLLNGESMTEARARIEKAAEFFTEILSTFEMSLRGYRESTARLVALNETLECQVAERTAALSDSERRFRDIAEVGCDWIWETDLEHRYTAMGESSQHGGPTAALIGKTRWETSGGDVAAHEVWRRHKADLDEHRPFRDLRYSSTYPHGKLIHMRVSGTPIFDVAGRFLGYRGTTTNETDVVEARLRAEQAEALLRDAVESITGGFVICDAEDRVVLFNQRFADLYAGDTNPPKVGAPFEAFVRASIAMGNHPDAIGNEEAWLAERMAQHRASTGATELKGRHGRWFLVNEQRMSNGGSASVALDITSLKRTQEALLESEEHLNLAQHIAGIGSVEFYFDNGTTKWSDQFFRLLGLDPATTRPDSATFRALIHPEDVSKFDKALETTKCGADMPPLEYRINRADGETRILHREIAVIRNAAGNPFKMIRIASDVTERRQVEDNLRVSEERFRSIFSAVGDGIFLVSTAGGFVEVNEPGAVMLGYTPGELIGKDIETISSGEPPYTQREVLEWHRKARESGLPQTFDWHCKTKDGKLFWAEVSLRFAMIGGSGFVLAIVRDLTARHAIQAQLRQSQKIEAIGNLTGGMAHDFNNLLGVIIGNLDLVSEHVTSNADDAAMLRDALDAALRGADLTARLLAFARRQPLRPERVDVNELIDEITKLLSRTLGEDIEIALHRAPDLWPVVVDPAQLQSAIANLANNARDAMPKGGQLTIATRNDRFDEAYAASHIDAHVGDYIVIEVTDAGSGMPPDVVDKIFEPFFTTKEPGKGTGLGLSMVFGFMRQSGGHINVYSELGMGTTFRLYLPRGASVSVESAEGEAEAPGGSHSESILVVEDNVELMKVVIKQLNELGYHTVHGDTGRAALEILEGPQVIDLLLTDIVMPGGIDGLEIAREALVRRPELKVLLTSGFPDVRSREDASRPLKWRLLSKPYRKTDLAHVVREVLDE